MLAYKQCLLTCSASIIDSVLLKLCLLSAVQQPAQAAGRKQTAFACSCQHHQLQTAYMPVHQNSKLTALTVL